MMSINLSEKRPALLLDYCHFLVASFQNFTQTYSADHSDNYSHDQLNRLLNTHRISARDLWASVRNDIELDEDGYLLFDDTVISKQYGQAIQPVRRQWSGSEKRVIDGIGLVSCVYVNPKTHEYWIIDYRIYDVQRDSKTKLQHLLDMLAHAYFVKKGHEVKLFRLVSGSGRTEYIAPNDLSQSDANAAQQMCRVRWKIEQLHRELKQVTGIGKCQSRKHRAQRNHIACCL